MKRVIAIVGMPGSGKSSVCKIIRSKLSVPSVRFGQFTIDEMNKAGMALTQENERIVRERLRDEIGMDAYAKLALPKIKAALEENDLMLIDGLYGWSEYLYLRENIEAEIILGCVQAPRNLRYQRLARRDERSLSSEESWQRDVAEIEKLEKAGPIAVADDYILNDATHDDLRLAVHDFLERWSVAAVR